MALPSTAFRPAVGPAFALALAIGTAGGAVFAWFAMPLAWMLGAMSGVGLAAILRLPVRGWIRARPPMSAVIGTMLGVQFGPETLSAASQWWPALIALAAYLLIAGTLSNIYLRRVVRLDPATAFFSAMPGGLIDMVLLGAERGGDDRTIALMHSSRIFLVVLGLPPLMTLVTGASAVAQAAEWRPLTAMSASDAAWFLLTLAAGIVFGRLARLPAPYLIGPMCVSMVLHWSGLSGFTVPSIVIILAQIVLGTTIGCRFAGVAPTGILSILAVSAGATLILLLTAVGFASGLSPILDVPAEGLLLAFSPGGLAEMSLVALALNLEVAFVVTCHAARIIMVVAAAGLISKARHPAGKN